MLLVLLCLPIPGCSAGEREISFAAVITALDGGSVLVEPLEGEDIRKSADRISFSREDLEDIGEKTGDTVLVTYAGDVMESYPAQIRAVS